MKTLKTFNKKGCCKIELITDTFGVFVRVSKGKKTVSTYWYAEINEAIDMFWYCVCLWSGINKYIK